MAAASLDSSDALLLRRPGRKHARAGGQNERLYCGRRARTQRYVTVTVKSLALCVPELVGDGVLTECLRTHISILVTSIIVDS